MITVEQLKGVVLEIGMRFSMKIGSKVFIMEVLEIGSSPAGNTVTKVGIVIDGESPKTPHITITLS